jgi:hypothetical protein
MPYAVVYTNYEDEQSDINAEKTEEHKALNWRIHFCYNLSIMTKCISSLNTTLFAIEIVYFQVLIMIEFS